MNEGKQPSRLSYFTGESLNTSDFITEQEYILQRFQTNVSSLNIWGIAFGLTVSLQGKELNINPGVAFDYEGRALSLGKNFIMTLDELQLKKLQEDQAYLVMSYGEVQSDYTKESFVGGFKRIVEIPVFTIQTNLEPHSLALACFQAGNIYYDIRRYCSQKLGSLTFACSSKAEGVCASTQELPSLSGYYGKDFSDKKQGSCLRIDALNILMSGPLKIIPHKSVSGKNKDLLFVKGSVKIDKDLNVDGVIKLKGESLRGSPWKFQENNPANIYYNTGSVIVGKIPTETINEKLSVCGKVKIAGDIICYGAGSKFIGDGSGLTNLPNNPWLLGTDSSQNNVFYPGQNPQGGSAQGAVGIGPFSSLSYRFPDDASLIVRNKTYLQKLSGVPVSSKTSNTVSECEPLHISSSITLENEDKFTTNLSIAKGELILHEGDLKIIDGNLSVSKGDLTVNGTIKATSYYGDGSHLTGVGSWEINDADRSIYYMGDVLVGAKSLPSGSDVSFYVKGKANMGALEVCGEVTIDSLLVRGPIVPCAGSTSGSGILFPKDIGGGGGDSAWVRYYSSGSGGGDPCTLEIGISNDDQDHIFLNPSGNVGIGVSRPDSAKLVVADGIAVERAGKIEHVLTAPDASHVIAGSISNDLKTVTGNGFGASRLSSDTWCIALDNKSISKEPVVVATSNEHGCVVTVKVDSTEKWKFYVNFSGGANPPSFNFIAVL